MNSKDNKTTISPMILDHLGVSLKNFVGAISCPKLQQPSDLPICTWVILLTTITYFKEFFGILQNFSKKKLDQFQTEIQREAIRNFKIKERESLRSSPGLTWEQIEKNARNDARINIFDKKSSLPGFVKKSWTKNRVSAELGGNPDEQRQEIKAFLEEGFQPYHLILATRCNHSFFYFMIGSGLVLIYDTIFSHLFIVNKEGATQHFFRKESLGDQDNDIFDSNDVYIAYQNMRPITGDFGQDALNIFMAQLLKVHINIKIKINLGMKLLNVLSPPSLNNWKTMLENDDDDDKDDVDDYFKCDDGYDDAWQQNCNDSEADGMEFVVVPYDS